MTDPLSNREKTALALIIQQQLTELAETISGLQDMIQPIAPDNAIGRLTRMDAINTRGANERALQQARQHEQQLTHALQRVDKDPDFGYCEECGELIPIGRLQLVPEAQRCIACTE